MTKRQEIVAITRSWIGTPYHHQESLKGIGCDCLGLLRGVWREFYGSENPEQMPNYSPSWGDHRTDDPLMMIAKKYFVEHRGEPREGDLLLFRMRRGMAVKHCSIVSDPMHMVHAYSLHQVREDEITEWWKKKLVGKFRFKGVR
jgi:NlpC/P60 family putative phage cell wall peptidase